MIRIVSDSSTLYSTEEGKQAGIIITPLSVSINGNTYREFDEISSQEFLSLVEAGGTPTTSQPSIGEKMAIYETYQEDTIIDITLADGLSGTYQSACMAKSDMETSENIHVLNATTLCGPHRYLVNKAVRLVNEGKSCEEILAALKESIADHLSFLIPQDYAFLKRGGRLTPAAATLGGLLKLVPIMTQTADGTRLEKCAVKRTIKGAVEEMIKQFKERGVDDRYHVSISHAGCLERAKYIKNAVIEACSCEVEIYELSPAFITQGGPGCVALQAIKK